jgi:hypothetical protein
MKVKYIVRILFENRMEVRFGVLKADDRILLKLAFKAIGGGGGGNWDWIFLAVITVQRQALEKKVIKILAPRKGGVFHK